MPGYDSRPLTRTIKPPTKTYRAGTACPICGLIRPAGWVGRCRACLDARDMAKQEKDT